MSSQPISSYGITVTALLAVIVIGVAPTHAGTWVVDTKSGCQVWNPNPQLDESVSWSGSCDNGRAEGRGIAQWSRNGKPGETDEGEWRNGRQVNKGTQSWSTGRYEGELSDGEPNGHGVLTLQKLRYEGEFRNGRPNGFGTLTTESESVRGTWKDGCLQGSRRASIGVPLSACR
jgi:MORN repeat